MYVIIFTINLAEIKVTIQQIKSEHIFIVSVIQILVENYENRFKHPPA